MLDEFVNNTSIIKPILPTFNKKIDNIIDKHSTNVKNYVQEYGIFISVENIRNLYNIFTRYKPDLNKYYSLWYKSGKLEHVEIRKNLNKLKKKNSYRAHFLKKSNFPSIKRKIVL